MLNSAVICLVFLCSFLTGCTAAEANVASGRVCAIASEPIAPSAETAMIPMTELPIVSKSITDRAVTLEVSGYTSSIAETDSTPCIAADNSDICRRKAAGEEICSSNAFKLGTRIHVDGLGECVVADRMNRRYDRHVDWYFGAADHRDRARKIGRTNRTVTIVR